MNTVHVRYGIPDTDMSAVSSTEARWCSCACSICMAGDCCQLRRTEWAQTSATNTTTPVVGSCVAGHDYAVLNPWKLYCRKCGETKFV